MTDETTQQDLRDRLSLIEDMLTEGRRITESWGWTFVLWGVAYMIAIAWSAWGAHAMVAWPVTMGAATVITFVVVSMQSEKQPETTLGRAVVSIWIALAVTMVTLFAALSIAGKLTDPHVFIAVIAAILGMANGASGLILRWKMQIGCAAVWWAVSVAACFGTSDQALILFLGAIFLCQIVFGIYGMVAEARVKKQRGAAHA